MDNQVCRYSKRRLEAVEERAQIREAQLLADAEFLRQQLRQRTDVERVLRLLLA